MALRDSTVHATQPVGPAATTPSTASRKRSIAMRCSSLGVAGSGLHSRSWRLSANGGLTGSPRNRTARPPSTSNSDPAARRASVISTWMRSISDLASTSAGVGIVRPLGPTRSRTWRAASPNAPRCDTAASTRPIAWLERTARTTRSSIEAYHGSP